MSNNTTYNPADMWLNIQLSMNAVRSVLHTRRLEWLNSDDEDVMRACNAYRAQRGWVSDQMERFTMHPVIKAAIEACRPNDWHQLLLEWPHISEGDRTRIAYTQNEAKGQKNVQTVTSVGKYLNRHFDLPDHTIRDLVARYGSASSFKFVHTTAEMIYHLHKGPGSCMVWRDDRGIHCRDGVSRHPYEAYDPKYGWHMAVRIEGDETVGRALCMTSPTDDKKYYVRTYARPSNNGGYSETDNGMENWLTEQGYHKRDCWRDGEKMAYHETSDHFLAPFLDGGEKRVTIDVGNRCVVVDSDGEYICDQTGGCPTDDAGDFFDCEDCGDRTSDDDGYWIGRGEDTRVCESCLGNDYTYVYGRRGSQYYVHNDNVVYVDSQSESYDQDYLDDNEIIELNNGEYAPLDEAVEINGDWYHVDDDRICRTEDTDEFLLVDDGCWQCTHSGEWYTDSVDFIEVSGEKFHPKYCPDEDGDTAVVASPVATKPEATMLTMEMLSLTHMLWDYSISMNEVTVSLTYMHDGHKLYAQRVFTQEFVNGVDRAQFNKLVRNELCSELMLQAHNNSVATI
jgi:hypothetical protein